MCNYRCMGKNDVPKPFTDYEYIVPKWINNGTACSRCHYFKKGEFFIVCPKCHFDLLLPMTNIRWDVDLSLKKEETTTMNERYIELLIELVKLSSEIEYDWDASEFWNQLDKILKKHEREAILGDDIADDDDDDEGETTTEAYIMSINPIQDNIKLIKIKPVDDGDWRDNDE